VKFDKFLYFHQPKSLSLADIIIRLSTEINKFRLVHRGLPLPRDDKESDPVAPPLPGFLLL